MYEFFTKKPRLEKGIIINPEINNVRPLFKEDIDELKSFYRSFTYYLSDSFILCSFIKIAKDYAGLIDDKDKFVFLVKSRMNEIVTSFGLTANFNYGKMHKNEFFGNTTREFIVATSDDFDSSIPWQDLAPLTCLYHDQNGLDLIIPAPGMTNSKTFQQPVVLQINIPMLLWQFSQWYKVSENKELVRFVRSYPLLNYMDSHLDIAMINRFKDNFYNSIVEDAEVKKEQIADSDWRFIKPTVNRYNNSIINHDRRIDKIHDSLYQQLKNKRLAPDEFLSCIPTIINENALRCLYLGERPSSRQIEWVLGIARLRYIGMILRYGNLNKNVINTDFKRHITTDLQALIADKSWSMMAPALSREVRSDVKTLIRPYL